MKSSTSARRRRPIGRTRLLVLAWWLGLFLAAAWPADSVRAQAGRLDPVAQLGGPTSAATWHRGQILTGIGPRLLLLEACDPAWTFERFRSEPLGGIVRHVAARDGLAYVAAGAAGLQIFALDPQPRRIGGVAIDGESSKVVLQGDHAYVAAGAAGMSVVDIRQPDAPRVVGRLVEARGDAVITTDLAVRGSFAYVVSRNLMQVDITDPSQPRLARGVEDWADAVAIEGDLLYAAPSDALDRGQRFGHLRVYDISVDRNPPRLIAATSVGDRARRLAVDRGRVYFQAAERLLAFRHDGAGGLQPAGALSTPDSVLNLDVGGGWIWLGAGPSGLRAARDLNAAGDSLDGRPLIPSLTSLASPERIAVDPQLPHRLYVEDEGSGNAWGPGNRIAIVDLVRQGPAGPYEPVVRGSFPAEVAQGAMQATGGHLFIGAPEETLRVFDVGDPAAAREVAAVAMPPDPVSGRRAPIWRIDIEQELAYLANDEWLRVLDVSDPAAPREVSAWRSSGGATDLAVEDRRAYVLGPATGVQAGRPSLQIVDLFKLDDPLAFGTVSSIGFRGGVEAADGLVYVEGLQVIDAGDPDAPFQRSRVDLEGRNRDNAFAGGFLYLARADANGLGELRAFDLRQPDAPVETARQMLPDEARSIALTGNLAVVAAQGSGLVVLETGLDLPLPPSPTPGPRATARPELTETIWLPLVARGGLGRCPSGPGLGQR